MANEISIIPGLWRTETNSIKNNSDAVNSQIEVEITDTRLTYFTQIIQMIDEVNSLTNMYVKLANADATKMQTAGDRLVENEESLVLPTFE